MTRLVRKATLPALLRSFAAGVVLLLAAAAGGCASGRPATRVTVLTYNIYHGEDANGRSNLDAVAAIINTLRPDLVALQEVDNKTTRVKGLDLTAELSRRTGMAGHFAKAMDYAGGGYGEAVLSRLPVLGVTNHALPHTAGAEPRAALEVEVQLADGRRVLFVGTHLDHQRDPANRNAQAARIRELYADSKLPVILAGDLNAVPESDVISLLASEWLWTAQSNPAPTYPAVEPDCLIDYIMVKPAGQWRVVGTRVIEEKVASDHRPVLAVLELLPEKQVSGGRGRSRLSQKANRK
ncbi:MAG TPA: endonuclease/exonuclease/phosphatase family protein [Anaerohalosphaeraceae bacterium]|nr:endonuclease/exonuclease/phosphatase family protein [Anaerohalosphaeraceae bacterium]HRT49774.1 endonuclease/exonuclease/phosphatase family protein [Anaerohalosphaeraceae bacterium]HRT85566.1 endonuclease/exonuclease/phosphatase family protein [Anaerohalosphaeraceae bacterium]